MAAKVSHKGWTDESDPVISAPLSPEYDCRNYTAFETLLKILHTNIGIYPERGGPPAVIVNLAAAQVRAGHTVAIASADSKPGVFDSARRMLSPVPGGDLVTVHVLPLPSMADLFLGRTVKLPKEDFDVVHVHEVWNPFDALVARAASSQGIPYAVTVHGVLCAIRLRRRWLKKRLARKFYVDRMLRRARFVQGLTEHECDQIRRLVPTAKVCRVPNGFSSTTNCGLYQGRLVDALAGKPFLLFMSRIHIMKGLDLLLAAFEEISPKFPELQLVLAGPNEGGQDLVERFLQKSQCSHRIHLTGMVGGEEKTWLLTNATAFVLPSRSEGFSVAILEALSMGVPVIMSKECHFPEAVAAHAALECDLDTQSLASAIAEVISAPQLRDRMSIAARELAHSNYTWDQIAHQVSELYLSSRVRS